MRIRKRVGKIIFYIVFGIVILATIFPILLSVNTAFKTPMETANSVLSLPSSLYLNNFVEGMKKSNFGNSLVNSCIITFPSVALVVILSAMGGYTIARNGQKLRLLKGLDKIYLASLMIPFQILMIPVYKMFKSLNLLNSHFGMILMLTGYSIAYATFLYVGFVKTIPKELEEAALIFGCGPFKMFFKIVFPLLAPISATVAALHIMWLWNDFNISIVLLQKDSVRTLTVMQYYFFGEYSSEYGLAFAASIICMIPVLACFVLLQKYLVSGITAGAVKS